MTNGSLEDQLFKINSNPLLWKERLKICIGVARGLQHLHSSVKHGVIHCDVKPGNILLDENWVAKVTNFTLSKLIPNDIADESLTVSRIHGNYGYMDQGDLGDSYRDIGVELSMTEPSSYNNVFSTEPFASDTDDVLSLNSDVRWSGSMFELDFDELTR
ncbi:receptor-like protein kinase FERONIA [Camellia sinensis]|uniref:receptor-like protein kinase FERONIA n=1 Tax=Camellia sinensis TaxID=4442 RepID=UPI0010368741|nr:receptor-like protein kinase FERONIA [Camellia sinensis]